MLRIFVRSSHRLSIHMLLLSELEDEDLDVIVLGHLHG